MRTHNVTEPVSEDVDTTLDRHYRQCLDAYHRAVESYRRQHPEQVAFLETLAGDTGTDEKDEVA